MWGGSKGEGGRSWLGVCAAEEKGWPAGCGVGQKVREGLGIIEGGARSSREEDREDIMPFQAGTSPPSLVLPLTPLISPSWPGWTSISGGPKQYTPSSTPSLRAHPALLTICPLPPLLATDWTSISGPKQCTPSSTHSTTCRTAASSCRRASFSPQPPPPPLLPPS